MTALNRKEFKLPRVERETFILLLKLGSEYNRELAIFSIKNYNNIEKLVDAISSVLNVQRVKFLQSCIVCGGDFLCRNCKYYDLCTTKDLPFRCICPECLLEEKNEDNSNVEQGTLDLLNENP